MNKRILAAMISGLIFAIAGAAAAGSFVSSAGTDFFSGGKHQFYVWCAGTTDTMATATGLNAEDAQLKLYDSLKAKGHSTCWPVWQGRVGG